MSKEEPSGSCWSRQTGGCLKVPGMVPNGGGEAGSRHSPSVRDEPLPPPPLTMLLPPQSLERMRLKMEIAAEDVDELPLAGPGH